jgi:hypothetical protein
MSESGEASISTLWVLTCLRSEPNCRAAQGLLGTASLEFRDPI